MSVKLGKLERGEAGPSFSWTACEIFHYWIGRHSAFDAGQPPLNDIRICR